MGLRHWNEMMREAQAMVEHMDSEIKTLEKVIIHDQNPEGRATYRLWLKLARDKRNMFEAHALRIELHIKKYMPDMDAS